MISDETYTSNNLNQFIPDDDVALMQLARDDDSDPSSVVVNDGDDYG